MEIVEAIIDFVDGLVSGNLSLKAVLWIIGSTTAVLAVAVAVFH
jgi:hypothetical protein